MDDQQQDAAPRKRATRLSFYCFGSDLVFGGRQSFSHHRLGFHLILPSFASAFELGSNLDKRLNLGEPSKLCKSRYYNLNACIF